MRSKEYCLKMSVICKKAFAKPELRAKRSLITKRLWEKGVLFHKSHHTEETKEKIRQKRLGHKWTDEQKAKQKILMNQPHIIKKISSASKARWKDPKYRMNLLAKMKVLWNTEEHRRKILRRRIPSGFEEKILSLIKEYKYSYKYVGNGEVWIGNANPDFINCNGQKKVIEVYAKFQKSNDYETQRAYHYRKYGFSTLFINEEDILDKKWRIKCLKKLQSF